MSPGKIVFFKQDILYLASGKVCSPLYISKVYCVELIVVETIRAGAVRISSRCDPTPIHYPILLD